MSLWQITDGDLDDLSATNGGNNVDDDDQATNGEGAKDNGNDSSSSSEFIPKPQGGGGRVVRVVSKKPKVWARQYFIQTLFIRARTLRDQLCPESGILIEIGIFSTSNNAFLSSLWTKLAEILYTFNLTWDHKSPQKFAKSVHRRPRKRNFWSQKH